MNAITLPAVAESCAWCIVQVTLFATSALLIYGLVRRQSASRNVLLLAASLAIVGLITITCLSPWPRWEFAFTSWSTQSRTEAPTTIADIVVAPSDTLGASDDGLGAQQSATPRPSLSLRNEDLRLVGVTDSPVTRLPAMPTGQPWWRLAACAAWLLAGVGIVRFLAGLAFVHRYRRQSVPIDDAHLLAEFHSLARELQITVPVELVELSSIGVAATIGWRRPLVLLPSLWRDWTVDERRAVLAHELSHVAQRHFPLCLVGQAAVAAHFYHPLVHWLGRQLRLEQEIAADRLAATIFGNRRHYATVLAGLALGPNQPSRSLAGVGLFMSRPLLMRRIAMLRQWNSATQTPSRLVGSLSLALLLLAMLVALGLRATPRSAAADRSLNHEPAAKTGIETINSTTALLQVSDEPTTSHVWSLVALLKSVPVIQPTLRRPEIANLPIIAAQNDPLQWVIDHLDVGPIADSNVVYVRMKDAGRDTEQLRTLVDAVVQKSLVVCLVEFD